MKTHYAGANLGLNWVKIGDAVIGIWPPNVRVLSFQIPDFCAKFRRNRLKIAILQVFVLLTPPLFYTIFGGVPIAPDLPCWGQCEQVP